MGSRSWRSLVRLKKFQTIMVRSFLTLPISGLSGFRSRENCSVMVGETSVTLSVLLELCAAICFGERKSMGRSPKPQTIYALKHLHVHREMLVLRFQRPYLWSCRRRPVISPTLWINGLESGLRFGRPKFVSVATLTKACRLPDLDKRFTRPRLGVTPTQA